MCKPVLFASTKPLERAENLKAVYDAFDGSKAFVQVDPWRHHADITSGKYDLMVIDEYPTETPGKIILLGHGIAGGKTSGLEQPHPYMNESNSKLITYTITTSPGTVGLVARYEGVKPETVLPLGMPRTDKYIGKKKGDGYTELADKKAYLYAPTYRNKEETPMPLIDWQWLDEQLSDDELIVVKPHMMTSKMLHREYDHIKEVSSRWASDKYLYDCDVLITDYSSIMFDGYLLGKPCVLFEKNKGYLDTRGMYLEYPYQYSSRYVTNEKDLLDAVRSADGLTEVEKDCLKLVAESCDGEATKRVCDLIKENQ